MTQHTRRLDGETALARMRFAAQVRKARLALRLSQAQVDRLAGGIPGDTHPLESGGSVPGPRRLAVMAVLELVH